MWTEHVAVDSNRQSMRPFCNGIGLSGLESGVSANQIRPHTGIRSESSHGPKRGDSDCTINPHCPAASKDDNFDKQSGVRRHQNQVRTSDPEIALFQERDQTM